MDYSFFVLPYSNLPAGTRISTALYQLPGTVTLKDPAIKAMTDLAFTQAFCISPLSPFNQANEKMIHCGVRMLLVSDNQEQIIGLITAEDILGERPLRYLCEHGGSREDILVQDIMTPMEQLDALNMRDVKSACIGDIVKTLEHHGRQHLLVYEKNTLKKNSLRGLFSATQIERQLGYPIATIPRAHNFAEIEFTLSG